MRFPNLSTRIRLIAVLLVLVLALVSTMTFQVVRTHAAPASVIVVPNSANEVDCNGWSAKYKAVTPFQRALCTDPLAIVSGKTARAIDNGWYVGHDEPSVKFISSAPGSGNHMTYFMQLAVDPHGTPSPSANGKGVTDYAELSGAVWFGLPICDPNSFPTIGGVRNDPCTPDSDTNTTATAGSAFMELQIYPPGFGPFLDAPSCDSTHYCAALNIDSAEVIQTNGALGYNPICMEPRNFAFLQRNGIPAGPPSPQLVDVSSFTPNSQTLLMNQGDSLAVTIKDTPAGLETSIFDFTTGQSGYIVASAANGFMNTDPVTCNGPFDARGQPYPSMQFETNVGGSEFTCNTATGASCTASPVSASGSTFYPYWTIGRACQGNFGSTIAGQTMNNFGGDAEYGTPDVARFRGTLTSPVLPNPQFSGMCSLNSFR